MLKPEKDYTLTRITKESMEKLRRIAKHEGRTMIKVLDLAIEERRAKIGDGLE